MFILLQVNVDVDVDAPRSTKWNKSGIHVAMYANGNLNARQALVVLKSILWRRSEHPECSVPKLDERMIGSLRDWSIMQLDLHLIVDEFNFHIFKEAFLGWKLPGLRVHYYQDENVSDSNGTMRRKYGNFST